MATTTLSKAEWQRVKDEFKLYTTLKNAKFKIDGYEVTLICEYIRKDRLGLAVYVNNLIEGKWFSFNHESDECKRFYPSDLKGKYSKKTVELVEKAWRKKAERLKRYPDLYDKVKMYRPTFRSINELIRTWEANNESIELVKLGWRESV